ncbi:MAG: carbohydrate-binding domain-containing protein, partial [Ruminococcaceae bacterium]|nr:carbohydrate-binding domain-containing protein [Oscillospiraceae bacterium]
MKKRILSLLLTLVMILGMIPATTLTAFAESRGEVYVGGVGMNDGDYLAVGATTTRTTKPSGGYAYYNNGTLTLNNYSYAGKGYQYDSEDGYYATVFADHALTLELVGTNSLKQTASLSKGIRVGDEGFRKLAIQGDGSLNVTSTQCGISVKGSIVVNGGTIISTATDGGMYKSIGIESIGIDVTIKGGNVTVAGDYGLWVPNGSCEIKGGTVTATGIDHAIEYSTGFTALEGMYIQASTTTDGELGEYVAANHDSYKKIVITPPEVYVGGVKMYDGDYLAVDATATQTTKPSGGYAYYKNGTLTINNYSYEGKG